MVSCCVCEHVPSFAVEASVTLTVKVAVPAAVGVPEIAPAPLNDNPAGRAPLATLQVSVPAPPLDWSVALYAVPAVPPDKVVVLMVGSGETVTGVDFVFEVSATDVAVIVTETFAAPDVGALYVTPVVVLLVNVPQLFPVHDVPDTVQLTPLPLESLLTAAVKFRVCP